jgi:hypothetical protein
LVKEKGRAITQAEKEDWVKEHVKEDKLYLEAHLKRLRHSLVVAGKTFEEDEYNAQISRLRRWQGYEVRKYVLSEVVNLRENRNERAICDFAEECGICRETKD